MKHKTFKVKDLVEQINSRLKNSTCSSEARFGMISVLESVLHETGNYHGFNYLETVWGSDGNAESFGDESRRYYYYKEN